MPARYRRAGRAGPTISDGTADGRLTCENHGMFIPRTPDTGTVTVWRSARWCR